MEKNFKLVPEDLLEENHYPVQIVFNALSNSRFISVLEGISNGHGFGEDYGACVFPDDLDEYDILTDGLFDGVEFGLHSGKEILLDYQTFYYYLKKVCDSYLVEHTEDNDRVKTLLEKCRKRYGILIG